MLFHKHDGDAASKLETRLLISCHKAAPGPWGFYEIDLKNNDLRQLFSCDARGLAPIEGGFIGGSVTDGLFRFDNDLNITDCYALGVHDQHGVAVSGDGLVYAAETARNRVGIYRLDPFERVDEIVISTEEFDRNHVNDILVHEGRLLVSMFSYHGSWRTNWDNDTFDGTIVEYDIATKRPTRLIASGLRMPHTVRMFDGKLTFCESFNQNVTSDGEILAQFSGYTRGLAFDGRFYYIGQSAMRHWGKHQETNLSGDVGIHILDTETRMTRFVPVPTQQIYDIVIVGGASGL